MNNVEETEQNRGGPVLGKEKLNLLEMMFSMERGACAVAQANLDNPKQNAVPGEMAQDKDTDKDGESCLPPDTSRSGHAPWQEGVLERLRQDLTPQEYNMYVVHHGRMLLNFGQIAACTPREKDFVYGSLEPIPVQTLRSFKVKLHVVVFLLPKQPSKQEQDSLFYCTDKCSHFCAKLANSALRYKPHHNTLQTT